MGIKEALITKYNYLNNHEITLDDIFKINSKYYNFHKLICRLDNELCKNADNINDMDDIISFYNNGCSIKRYILNIYLISEKENPYIIFAKTYYGDIYENVYQYFYDLIKLKKPNENILIRNFINTVLIKYVPNVMGLYAHNLNLLNPNNKYHTLKFIDPEKVLYTMIHQNRNHGYYTFADNKLSKEILQMNNVNYEMMSRPHIYLACIVNDGCTQNTLMQIINGTDHHHEYFSSLFDNKLRNRNDIVKKSIIDFIKVDIITI